MKVLLACLAIPVLLLAGCSNPDPSTPDATGTHDDSMKESTNASDPVASAMSAAPDSVSKAATILTMDDKGAMKTLRKGTNGWTCMPDTPSTPGPDPMCLDENGLAFVMSVFGKTDPPKGKMGFGYMLMGGSDADNDDPYATAPPKGKEWFDTGPHVMVFNIGTSFAGYPTTADNPKAPYVMWPDTPYAHLMLPVE